MTIFETLQSIGIPCAYGTFKDREIPKAPPYIVYMGEGQEVFNADNTHYYRRNTYRVEYYFTKKSEATENAIESALLQNGYLYSKSEDVFIESEGVFVIYYYI